MAGRDFLGTAARAGIGTHTELSIPNNKKQIEEIYAANAVSALCPPHPRFPRNPWVIVACLRSPANRSLAANSCYPAAASGTAPNLRSREWNSATACSKSAGEKSGQRRSVKISSA